MSFLAFAETIQLVPDGTLFLHIAIILLMVFILNKTLFKPINRVLDDRERRTSGRSHEAREILHRIDENMARYERSLREARAEGYRLLEQQRTDAMNVRQHRLNAVREEVSGLIETEKNDIHAQAARARAPLEDEARRVAASVSAQILGRTVAG
jgi:F-type H+-transporting ATPase subunit b